MHGSTSQWNASDPECKQKCKTKSVLHTAANNKLITKAQRNANEVPKQQSAAHGAQQQKMIDELPPDMKKIIQILWAQKLMTKAQRIQIKVQKQQRYCAQQQKWYMNYCRIFIKVIQILQGHKLMTKAQRMRMKAQKQQSTTHKAKMLDELLPDMKKVIKLLWAKLKSTAHHSKNETWTSAVYEQTSWKYCGHTR